MKNKLAISLIATIVIIATAFGMSIAFYSDKGEVTNVLTVGNVYIDLYERDATGKRYGYDEDENDETMTYSNVLPSVFNIKETYIKNTGENAAYVRMKISMPEEWYDIIHLNFNADNSDSAWYLASHYTYVDNGLDCIMLVYNYNEILPAGNTTDVLLKSVVVNSEIDNSNIEAIAESLGISRSDLMLTIKATGEAVQAEGFVGDMDSAWQAFEDQV